MFRKEKHGGIAMNKEPEFVSLTPGGAIYILGTDRFFRIESYPDSHWITLIDLSPNKIGDIKEDIKPIAQFNTLSEAENIYRIAAVQRTVGDVMAVFNAA